MDKKNKRIAFLVQLPRKVSPSQRFRIEQFEPALLAQDFHIETFSFIGPRTYRVYYKEGFWLQKAWGVLMGFLKRLGFLLKAPWFDYIFLQREAAPIGPPVYEWLLAKVLRKKIILDFDDAIWISDTSGVNRLMQWAKCYWKIKCLCKWSDKVSVGNTFLADWARKYNENVVIIPTCVDVLNRYNVLQHHTQEKKVTIGWTGSHSTLVFLNAVYPVLKSLEHAYDFRTVIICDRPPDISLHSLHFIPWREETEIQDLLNIDIGIMPLESDAWSEGKCGFKLIQYLALGIPAVASPVGINKQIIDSTNGFLCTTQQEWYTALSTLLINASLRTKMGNKGREKIAAHYSIQTNEASFLNLFD